MDKLKQAVIMAGGKGTRLASITRNEVPKPMALMEGKPILQWQMERLREYGVTDIVLIIGYLGEKIREYFQDGAAFGLHITYIEEKEPLGTAGAFYYLKEQLHFEEFILVFGDVFFDIDFDRMAAFHQSRKALVTLFAHPNAHPFDSDLIETNGEGLVVGFDSKNNVRDYWYDNLVNAGIYILSRQVCDRASAPVKTDFEKDILAQMVKEKCAVYAYCSPEYVKDVGTVDRITKASQELRSGLTAARNLKHPQRAVFLDRDGTLNEYRGFIRDIDEFVLYPGAAEAIRLINESGALAIVITNQPVIARGEASFQMVEKMHKKMKTLLGKEGVLVDDIFYCPHHPDKGFAGEVAELKIDCDCRKPKTGMIREACEKYHIDLSRSWMVGDSTLDMELARRAGLKSALVLTGEGGKDGKFSKEADLVCKDVLEAVKEITGTAPASR